MVDTKVTCLLLSLPRKRGEVDQGRSTGCAVPVPACLLVCQLGSWALSFEEFVHLSSALGQEPFLLTHGPQQCLVQKQTLGRKAALPPWPGSSHGVRCVSLLRYVLPASAGWASSRNTKPGRSQWCWEMSEALLHAYALALFSCPELDAVQHSFI